MKKILGLDLGTNSIGWALIENNFENKTGKIINAGSRIIPMPQDKLGDFEKGNSVSQTADRTKYRGVRRLNERNLLRRERLHRVLNILGFLPEHYAKCIDFNKKLGQFYENTEPKLVYFKNEKTNKNNFLFKNSFEEMLQDFKEHQAELVKDNKKIPYDWTIYYLRKKSLTKKIEKEELAWLLLNFNQKRGYYQLRGEDDDENKNKLVEFYSLLVTDVIDSGDKKGQHEIWYNVHLENGWIYRRPSKTFLDWKGKTKEFIVTTDIDEKGNVKKDKDGKEKRSFRAPQEDDWTLLKKKTEFDIEQSNKTVGCYIYDTLLINPNQKIKGKLVRTIERKFYKEELKLILEKQKEFHAELKNIDLYNECVEELYENNESHQKSIENKDFVHLFLNDIIFYQRSLKSKKSLISNCRYESRTFIKDGKKEIEPIKCIAKSHPLFQEFRLWQFIQNLKIYQREKLIDGKLQTDVNITNELLQTDEDYTELFEFLNDRKDIDQKALLRYFKLKFETHRWNYVDDAEKKYPCNKTRNVILNKLDKNTKAILTQENEIKIWHLLYSINTKEEIDIALKENEKREHKITKENEVRKFKKTSMLNFLKENKFSLNEIEEIKKVRITEKDYGSYSAKAIKKLLPLMRMGKFWNEDAIGVEVKNRINSITQRLNSIDFDYKKIDNISDDDIPKQVLKSFIDCKNPLKGLNTYQACYAVYGRHSEDSKSDKWKTPSDIERFLKEDFKQHSLHNPIVEQVITETLRVVKDIWNYYGNGEENFFDEIHIELGREMKNPADVRKQMTNKVTENENTNSRIKALLAEMLNCNDVENVRPYSPSQQEILKIYEECVLNVEDNFSEEDEDILKISKNAQPTKSELKRYKLWLEQKYRSPYTGEIIPLNKLFTPAYEIEHIIPQSLYFDDSFSNKVICESEVNKDKTNSTAYAYIKNNSGKKIELSYGKEATIFKLEAFEDFVKNNYSKNRGKMKKLLMEDIPDKMIERQLNDTRYISKYVKNLLSNVVREENEQETTSKNVLSSNGTITTILKQDWGLNDVWNEIITPRFERLNELTKSNSFGEWTNKEGKQVFQTQVPIELQKGFTKKRIDHRHHAMDALVIASASRNHINYLNNEFAKADKKDIRHDLRTILCFKKYNSENKDNYKWIFKKPWETYTQEAKEILFSTLISFKQNHRVINKTINLYQKWEKDDKGNLKKVIKKQEKGENWAIRKSLHTPMPYGKKLYDFDILKIYENVSKREFIIDEGIKAKVNEIFEQNGNKITTAQKYIKENPLKDEEGNIILVTAFRIETEKFRKRQPISKLSNRGQGGIKTTADAIKFINKVADFNLQQDLLKHLKENNNNIDNAFSPDGIDKFNSKRKIPVYKLPIAESGDKRFSLGNKIGSKHKWVEAAEGTNLFFAIYKDEKGNHNYESIPLNIVIERLKQKLSPVPESKFDEETKKEYTLLFYLSPNDFVYVPTIEERENPKLIDFSNLTKEQINRVYKMVSSSGNQCFFIKNEVAISIYNKFEYSALNKMEKSVEGIMIKDCCIPLKLDRLGNIIEAEGKKINTKEHTMILSN